MLNKDAFAMMKDGTRILNFSRDTLVNDADIKEALATGKIAKYVTDFPNPTIAGVENVITLPHLGASTEESEDNCAIMAVKQIADFIKKASGNSSEQKLSSDDINTIKELLDVLFERADDDKSRNQEFDMQKIAAAMAAVSHFCIITGGPGTGKTTTVAKLLLLLQKLNPSMVRL